MDNYHFPISFDFCDVSFMYLVGSFWWFICIYSISLVLQFTSFYRGCYSCNCILEYEINSRVWILNLQETNDHTINSKQWLSNCICHILISYIIELLLARLVYLSTNSLAITFNFEFNPNPHSWNIDQVLRYIHHQRFYWNIKNGNPIKFI